LLFERPLFDSLKLNSLLKQVIQIGTNKDSLVFNFFSGSATTAHSVIQLNSGNGDSRKLIMVRILDAVYDAKAEDSQTINLELHMEQKKLRRRLIIN